MTDRRTGRLAEDAVRALCWGTGADSHEMIARAVVAELGAVLEQALRSKTLCLLAAYLHDHPIPELDRTVTRFLDSTLRTNRYKTYACRVAALADTAALDTAGVSAVVLGGLSVEHALYAGTGARQFSDIDLLIAPDDAERAHAVLRTQGYQPSRGNGTWTRQTGDPIVPLIVVDLATTLPRGGTDDDVTELLARRAGITVPAHDNPLPILAPSDAANHTLARLAARPRWALVADAIRQVRAAEPPTPHHSDVLAGWSVLRSHWPLLPVAPARLPSDEEPHQ
ncbi:nucleotidyltransferase family protein [Saccharothrix deserti]|uniref:nucleotidyltransferase family protein n=1 Tax=Saccharothrix deserti TaxID=2593674 RepID=UPI00131BBDF3|nr:nucleotidyltransferase family protein [Saccharothrix deserti]